MSFLLFAAALGLLALAFVVIPVVRSQRRLGLQTLLAVVAVLAIGIGMYAGLGTSLPWAGNVDKNPELKITALIRDAQAHPDEWHRWLQVAHAYKLIGRYGAAAEAYRKVLGSQAGHNPGVIAAYAETLVLANPDSLTGHAGKLFSQVLKEDPANPRALWWGGMSAYRQGNFDTAISRWKRLEAMNPPAQVKHALDEYLARARNGGVAAGKAGQAGGTPWIKARVQLADKLAPAPQGAVLFVYLQRQGGGGPPIAVKRIPTPQLPVTVSLSGADSPLGQTQPPSGKIVLGARLSVSGRPLPASGDLETSTTVTLDKDSAEQPVSLVIDHKIP